MIVTLTTDFGTRDGYVAAMKGAMLSVEPALTLVDVTHEVPAQDVMEAAFVLRQSAGHFPAGTVHLVVVDPGVGTERRALAASFDVAERRHRFVGPDNGLLPLIAGDAVVEAVALDRTGAWGAAEPSATFHGRDVFGPAAAALARGAALGDLGSPVEDPARMHWPLPRADDQGITAMVLHVDRFGNCLTNVTEADLDEYADGRTFKCYAGSTIISEHVRTYGDTTPGEPVTLFGSGGLLEIAVNQGHAADLLSVGRGSSVNLIFEPSDRAAPRRATLADA